MNDIPAFYLRIEELKLCNKKCVSYEPEGQNAFY